MEEHPNDLQEIRVNKELVVETCTTTPLSLNGDKEFLELFSTAWAQDVNIEEEVQEEDHIVEENVLFEATLHLKQTSEVLERDDKTCQQGDRIEMEGNTEIISLDQLSKFWG